MAENPNEQYREHPVWALMARRMDMLADARYEREDLEQWRIDIVEMLRWGRRSVANPVPGAYKPVLKELQAVLNAISSDEGQFRVFISNMGEKLRELIRSLPGPPNRQLTASALDALDSAVALRKEQLEVLNSEARVLREEIATLRSQLDRQNTAIKGQNDRITAASATVAQVVEAADERLESEWTNRLQAWEVKRAEKDQEAERQVLDRLQLLAGSATVGRRLVEQAAGSLTATDWADRAKRERFNAIALRLTAFGFFFVAVIVGGWILSGAIEQGFELTLGDGILRGALVLAIAGVGTLISAESRRHFREADSAEEVKLAFTALEPFLADAPTEQRNRVREALGDTVFIKNVLSRFANRDASKHSGATNQDLSEVIDLLTKSTDLAKKLNSTGTS